MKNQILWLQYLIINLQMSCLNTYYESRSNWYIPPSTGLGLVSKALLDTVPLLSPFSNGQFLPAASVWAMFQFSTINRTFATDIIRTTAAKKIRIALTAMIQLKTHSKMSTHVDISRTLTLGFCYLFFPLVSRQIYVRISGYQGIILAMYSVI